MVSTVCGITLEAVEVVAEQLVVFSRLESLLSMKEDPTPTQKQSNRPTGSLSIENGRFGWQQSEGPAVEVLRDLDLRVKPGELIAVVGKVGSGKTSLLNALIGELYNFSESESNVRQNSRR